MEHDRHALAVVRRRLDRLCDARTISGLSDADQAELTRLINLERHLLGHLGHD